MTTARSGPPPIVYILLILGLLGGGYWYFLKRSPTQSIIPHNPLQPNQSKSPEPVSENPNTPNTPPPTFAVPTSLASGTIIRIDGSTSMVTLNQTLKQKFEQQFPGTTIYTTANGSTKGLQGLLLNQADIAGISRPLTAQEQSQGLVAVPVTSDAIAVLVGNSNPFRKGFTHEQILGIFQGSITNWSQVGGTPGTIRVINRPDYSGTHQAFKELILKGANFGNTPNITVLDRDATTPLIRALGADGISYATYAQVFNQQTARTVAIDGLTPEAQNYPYRRPLFYAYRHPPSSVVQAFMGYITSEQGKQAIASP